MLLGAATASYPNVLTAFGDHPVVLWGSAAVALTNLCKLPLLVLPLRGVLIEQVRAE